MCLSMHGCIIIPQGTKIRINLTFFFRFLPSNFENDCWFLKQFLDFRALCFVWWTPCIVQLQLSRRRRRKDYREHHHHQPLEDGGACCCCYCNGDDFAKALEFSYFVSQWASRAYFARSLELLRSANPWMQSFKQHTCIYFYYY